LAPRGLRSGQTKHRGDQKARKNYLARSGETESDVRADFIAPARLEGNRGRRTADRSAPSGSGHHACWRRGGCVAARGARRPIAICKGDDRKYEGRARAASNKHRHSTNQGIAYALETSIRRSTHDFHATRGASWVLWSGAKVVTCILTRQPSIGLTIRNGHSRVSSLRMGMSAFGTKRTSQRCFAMSTFGSKADIGGIDQIVALATRGKIPTIYPWREFTVAGGLRNYGASIPDAYRQVGVYAGQILRGARPPNCRYSDQRSCNWC
jgi:hypothetical protein